MKRLFVLLLLAAGLTISSHAAFAGCPSSSEPYPGPAWNGPTYRLVSIGGCDVGILYCWRMEGGNIHYFINSVVPRVLGCPSMTPDQLIKAAINAFESDPPLSTSIGPCGDGLPTTVILYTTHVCWVKYFANGSELGDPFDPMQAYRGFQGCEGNSSCTKTIEYCQDLSTGAINQISETSSEQYDGSCTPAPEIADPWTGWIVATCYDIDPCNRSQ